MEFDRYIEPFLGSGAVLLFLKPEKWIAGDVNKDLYNIWMTVWHNPEYIKHKIDEFRREFIGLSRTNKLEVCQRITEEIPRLKYDNKRAVLFLIMTFCAFLGHIVRRGKFVFTSLEPKVYGGRKNLYFTSEKYLNNIFEVSEFLSSSRGRIYNADYKSVMSKARKNDFVFIDPPYIEDRDYQFNYNMNEELGQGMLEELLREVEKLDKRGVKWMMTQADTEIVKKMFSKYNIIEFKVYRLAAKSYRHELIIKNY